MYNLPVPPADTVRSAFTSVWCPVAEASLNGNERDFLLLMRRSAAECDQTAEDLINQVIRRLIISLHASD